MGHKISIDFGTTNSVIAYWQNNSAEFIALPQLSAGAQGNHYALIPSLLYVNDGRAAHITAGQMVRDQQLDRQADNRLFRNFKRGIASTESAKRMIDGVVWTDRDAGKLFLQTLTRALPYPPQEIEEFIVTIPVVAFDNYVTWLNDALSEFPPDVIRLIDEPTAAALGYTVTQPEALILVFDFGGGTLDLALVQLPKSREKTGGFLNRILGQSTQSYTAKVIAKDGQMIGGSDVDQWLLAEMLDRAALSSEELGQDYAALLSACEQAKIALSTQPSTSVTFAAKDKNYTFELLRSDLESILERHGFYAAVRRAVDKVMHVAHRRGIFREDVHHVLMVGGTSLMPSVQATLKSYFHETAVRCDKPFTAIAEGALQMAAGLGLEDYLVYSYGLRYRDAQGKLRFDEIIPAGSRYPIQTPIDVYLSLSHDGQSEIEFVIGAIEWGAVSTIEMKYEGGQAAFVAQAQEGETRVLVVNGDKPLKVSLAAGGAPEKKRLVAQFTVDAARTLRLSVRDLLTNQKLLTDQPVVILSDHPAELPAVADSKCAPSLAAQPSTQKRRLSLRGLATMLNMVPPEGVSLEVLAAALHSDEFYARYSAAEVLSKRGDREARLILQDVLDRGAAPQRANVAHHLHRLSWFVAEPMLQQAWRDVDYRVHEAAAYALCQMCDANAYNLLTESLPNKHDDVYMAVAWGVCYTPDARAVPALTLALRATEADVRAKVLEALAATASPAAINVVRGALADPDLDVKYAAMLSFIELQGAAALPEVAEMIAREVGVVRQHLLRGFFHATNYRHVDIVGSGYAEVVIEALAVAVLDDLPEARMMAVLPLAWIRHEQAAKVLFEAYRRELNTEVKVYIVQQASSLMSLVSDQLLEDALHSSDETLRVAAEEIQHGNLARWQTGD